MTILDNLRLAHTVISAVPDAALDLRQYKTECGTIACVAGHLAGHPHFAPFVRLELTHDDGVGSYSLRTQDYVALNFNFGPAAFGSMFAQRGWGRFDRRHPDRVYDHEEGEYHVHPPRQRQGTRPVAHRAPDRGGVEVTHLDQLLAQHGQARKAFYQAPTPSLGATLKRLEGQIKYERRAARKPAPTGA